MFSEGFDAKHIKYLSRVHEHTSSILTYVMFFFFKPDKFHIILENE